MVGKKSELKKGINWQVKIVSVALEHLWFTKHSRLICMIPL